MLSGKVVPGSVQTSGEVTRFRLRDVKGSATVRVSYAGGLPDQFKAGRDLRVNGQLRRGVFVGAAGDDGHEMPFEVRAEATLDLGHG